MDAYRSEKQLNFFQDIFVINKIKLSIELIVFGFKRDASAVTKRNSIDRTRTQFPLGKWQLAKMVIKSK